MGFYKGPRHLFSKLGTINGTVLVESWQNPLAFSTRFLSESGFSGLLYAKRTIPVGL